MQFPLIYSKASSPFTGKFLEKAYLPFRSSVAVAFHTDYDYQYEYDWCSSTNCQENVRERIHW